MAITLEANYAKKLGLPNYSSHQYSVTIRTELTDLSQVEVESARLYRLLQDAVDKEIVEVGYLPDASVYGMNKPANPGNGIARANGHTENGNGHQTNGHRTNGNGDHWNCTEGQRGFILRIIAESSLTKQDAEDMAQQLFGAGVTSLDKMQASQLIEELLEKTGKQNGNGQRRWSRQPARA